MGEEDEISQKFFNNDNRLEIVFDKYNLDKLKVLDVGCAYGHILRRCGVGSQGITSIDKEAEYGRKIGLNIITADIQKPNEYLEHIDGNFDVLLFSDVLEHLNNPHDVLFSLFHKLKPDGIVIWLYISKPKNALFRLLWRWWFGHAGYESFRHYYLFDSESSRYLLERSGYRVIDSFPNVKSRILGALLNNNFTEQVIIAKKDEGCWTVVQKTKKEQGGRGIDEE